MSDTVWSQVRRCFDTDDGSLPGIAITPLSASGVAAVYAMLRRRSRLVGNPPEFWDRETESSVPVDSVPNAAALVASGRADMFHLCISGVVANRVELPVLGVFVLPDSIVLDYRMGRDWNAERVAGLFELLRDCCDIDPGAVVRPADYGPPYPERFMRAWADYTATRQG